MRKRLPTLLFLAVVAAAASVTADSPRLASPPDGSAVRPGDTVAITVGEAPKDAEEWEAFLSVDGGRSYPIRVTPHLSIRDRSFTWSVPSLPAASACLRVRFGSGGVESEFALPERFSILPSSRGTLVAPGRSSAVGAAPALGEEGTIAWVEQVGVEARLVVPLSTEGMAPASRWSAPTRGWNALPRHRTVAAPPVNLVGRARPVAAHRIAQLAMPARRSLASLSRLNV